MTPDAKITPGPASTPIGLRVLRKRLISVLMVASKIRMGKNIFKIKAESKPMRRGKSSVTAKPASTQPVT